MNQTIKSSILLISLLGFSFFAFNFLNDSTNPQSETPTIETTVTLTTIQQKIEIDEFGMIMYEKICFWGKCMKTCSTTFDEH